MQNNYTISEFVTTTYAFILTKLFYRKARLIRRPFYLRGKSCLTYGEGFTTGHNCRFDLLGEMKTLLIGKNVEIGDNVHIVAHKKVEIGNNCLLASKIFITDTNHGNYFGNGKHSNPADEPKDRELTVSSVYIGENVWIGENVVILHGVTIGNGCIIGANSVVTKSIAERTIAAGVPAKAIKKWNNITMLWETV